MKVSQFIQRITHLTSQQSTKDVKVYDVTRAFATSDAFLLAAVSFVIFTSPRRKTAIAVNKLIFDLQQSLSLTFYAPNTTWISETWAEFKSSRFHVHD